MLAARGQRPLELLCLGGWHVGDRRQTRLVKHLAQLVSHSLPLLKWDFDRPDRINGQGSHSAVSDASQPPNFDMPGTSQKLGCLHIAGREPRNLTLRAAVGGNRGNAEHAADWTSPSCAQSWSGRPSS